MCVESIRPSNGDECFVGGTVMVDTGDCPDKGVSRRLTEVYLLPSVSDYDDPEQSSESSREDHLGNISVEWRPFQTADALSFKDVMSDRGPSLECGKIRPKNW